MTISISTGQLVCSTVNFGDKGRGYKGPSLMRDEFRSVCPKCMYFRQGTFQYKGLIYPVPSGPLYPKSTIVNWGGVVRVCVVPRISLILDTSR